MFVITCSENPVDDDNRTPLKPEINLPPNSSVNQSITPTLSWTCTDPDGDKLTYDVYFDTSNNPSVVVSDKSNPSYAPGTLQYNTRYYWKILAKDSKGADTTSDLWSFVTKSKPVVETVSQPSMPSGVDSGLINKILQFNTGGSSSSVGHSIQYQFNWGDGSYSGWSNSSTASNQWSNAGNYNINSRARCATHTSILSNSSSSKQIIISEIKKPELRVSTNNLDFDSTKTNLTFNITNSGDSILIWDITANQNWITINPINGTTTTETDQITVSVDRTGLSVGTHTGIITISSNGGSEIIIVSLEILADLPICSIQPDSLNFGDVLVGENKYLSFNIKNIGGGVLFGSIGESCNHYSIVSGNGSYLLTEGQSKTITVSFSPTSQGEKNCNVTISGGCIDVSCTGTGIKLPCNYTVTNPSSGVLWNIGDTRNIRWNSDNAGSNVKIELYKGSSRQCTIHSNTDNDGLYSWVGDDCGGGSSTDYRIKITDLDDGNCYDYSDYFELQELTIIKTINPTADSWVMESSPASNFGSTDYLLVGRDSDGTRFESMIKFNTLLNDIPSDAVVEKAELILKRQSYTGTVQMWVWIAWPLWYEYTVNYDTKVVGVAPYTSFSATSGGSTLIIDVTSQVNAWRDGDWNNYGFYLGYSSTPSSGSFVKFGSREASSNSRPVLRITYK